jgi:hypothetical protein
MYFDIIIYESGSFGGCYDYSLKLKEHYTNHSKVATCDLFLPKNATPQLDLASR